METGVLNGRVVFVKDPTALPRGVPHTEAIDALSRNNRAVILLSHGNKYQLPKDWILPSNVSIFEYELDLDSIAEAVRRVREVLVQHGVDLHSRYLDNDDALPMLLAGACLTLGPNTKVVFVNKPDQYSNIKVSQETVRKDTDWDLF